MKTTKELYAIYVNARARAWGVHDRLVTAGQFRKDHPDYVKACAVESRAYRAYLDAEKKASAA